MDQEIQEINEKMDEMMKLIKENQRMTRSLYHRARLATSFIIIKWIILIGLGIGAFYYIQPIFDGLTDTFNSLSGGNATFMDFIKSW